MGPVKRDIAPPKMYRVDVTDKKNKLQVEQTRIWLESLVKDKSKMRAGKDLPWDTEEDWPWDELEQFLDDANAWQTALEGYEIIDAWFGVVLEIAGYEEVLQKKEWISCIEESPNRKFIVTGMILGQGKRENSTGNER